MAGATPTTASSAAAVVDPDAAAAESREERGCAGRPRLCRCPPVHGDARPSRPLLPLPSSPRRRAAEQAAAARLAKEERARTAQAARDAAAARATDAEREAAVAQQERDAADARLQVALDRAAQEHAAAAPPLENDAAPDDAEDAEDFASADGGDPHLRAVLLQHEAAALLNLHAQAVAVQNIRLLVPLVLDVASTFYGRWRESFLIVGRYSLERHILFDAAVLEGPHGLRREVLDHRHHLRHAR